MRAPDDTEERKVNTEKRSTLVPFGTTWTPGWSSGKAGLENVASFLGPSRRAGQEKGGSTVHIQIVWLCLDCQGEHLCPRSRGLPGRTYALLMYRLCLPWFSPPHLLNLCALLPF